MPVANTQWALDSGGFTELSMFGGWQTTASSYASDVRRYQSEIGNLAWAAPQDWMCEPFIVEKTGLTVEEHQRRTVGNFLDLRSTGIPVIPVVQGYTLADYDRCLNLYDKAGVNLCVEPLVGLGSVCRRQATDEIGQVCQLMHDAGIISLHGFGCKAGAIERYGHLLASADSMAWSFGGRRNGTCAFKSRCANCLHYALQWRDKVINVSPKPLQMTLLW